METPRFLHKHPLKVVLLLEGEDAEHDNERTCDHCEEELSGQVYACDDCGFYLHEACGNLPQRIQHSFHSCALFLKLVPISADGAEHQEMMILYRCEACNFGLDDACALYQPASCKDEEEGHLSCCLADQPLKPIYVKANAELQCYGCKDSISGKCYVCQSCGYYLHEDCAFLPSKIQHFFHGCPLFLENFKKFKCNACLEKCSDTFGYYCRKCNFGMHVECTQFLPVHSDEDEILHWSHHHPLKLTYEEAYEMRNCRGCQKPISGNSYSCLSCEYYLHLSCANMSRDIQHFFHSCPLYLRRGGDIICDACLRTSTDIFSYYCKKCDFDMHRECTLFTPVGPDEEGILHWSHHHPLKLTHDEVDEMPICRGCQKHISGNSYACLSCGYHLHLSCANLPREIQHFFHSCPLLLAKFNNFRCNACLKKCYHSFCYCCEKCDFGMHVECSEFSPISSDEEGILHWSHHHPLKLTNDEEDEMPNCRGCQKSISGNYYACLSCGYYLHLSCAQLPREIQHFCHSCPLFLGIRGDMDCDACHQDCSNIFGYYCTKCDFNMHRECTLFTPIDSGEEGILHWSHYHPLKLTYEEADETLICRGCQKPISGNSYSCLSCGYYLHLSCAYLPREIRHFFHNCPLSLKIIHRTQCDACFKTCDSVFGYHCEECYFDMHATCTQFPALGSDDQGDRIQDLSHHHPLKHFEKSERHKTESPECNLCYKIISDQAYGACELCQFHIHKSCMGSHKPKISTRYSPITTKEGLKRVQDGSHTKHFLYLFEGNDSNEEHHQCHLCGREIPNHTAYGACEDCEFYIHQSCLGSPLEIQLPCHSCPLSLGCRQHFACNVCDAQKKATPYRCEECLFYVDVECARSSHEIDEGDKGELVLHFCHHHPLQLLKDPKRDKTDELLERKLKCLVCVETASGLTYGCKWCGFYLHKSCLDVLPQSISIGDCSFVLSRFQTYCRKCGNYISEWGFFPDTVRARPWCIPCAMRETLSLWVSPSSMSTKLHFHPCSLTLGLYPNFTCNACFTHCHSHAYYCNQCEFYVGIKCAQISRKGSHSENEQIQHYSHCHTLQLSKGANVSTNSCKICGILCLEASYFCSECDFHVHGSCLDTLPQKIDHHYLYCTLVLLTTLFYRCIACQKENNSGLTFLSIERGFKLCMECVLRPKNKLNDDGSFTSIHHWHQLTLMEELEKDDAQCLLCRKRCSTLTYSCNQCKDYFHKSCAEMSLEMHHPLHKRHPLTLISSLLLPESSRQCSLCQGDLLLSNDPHHSGVYRYACKEYSFQLDKKCVTSTPSIQYQNHPHLLTVVESMQGSEDCQVCFASCENNIVFRCAEVTPEKEICNFSLHLTCGPLPCEIKHSSHVHSLILEDFYVEENYTDEFPCHVCEKQRPPKLPIYLCGKGCPMMCEIECVISEVMPKLLGAHGEVELRTTFPNVVSNVITKDVALINMPYASENGDVLHIRSRRALDRILSEMRKSPIAGIVRKWKSEMLRSQGIKLERGDDDKNLFRFSKDAFQDFSSKFECTRLTLQGPGIPKFISQHDGPAVEGGEYILPLTLLPIYQELFGKNSTVATTFERSRKSKPFKSVFVFMLCAVVHNMRVTKLVDVTNERALQWLTLLKLVERAGFEIDFILDKIKLVWETHFLIQSKELVDATSEHFREGIIKLSSEEEELERKLEETRKKKTEMQQQIDCHYAYEKSGMKSFKKELKDVLLIKWKPASSLVIENPSQQTDTSN